MDLSVYCRVCMNYILFEYIDLDSPLNNSTYLEHFNFCTKLDVVLEDELPKTICISCAKSLQIAYTFIKSAVESERFLRDNFSSEILKNSDGIKHEPHIVDNLCESTGIYPFESPKQMKEEADKHVSYEVKQIVIQPEFEIVFHEEEPKENQMILPNEKDILAVDTLKESELVAQTDFIEEEEDSESNIDLEQEEAKLYECTKCAEAFVTEFDLKDHEFEIHKNLKDSLVCRLCGETFINRTRLSKHQNVDHKDKEVGFCIVCNQSFGNEKWLRRHVTREHAPVEKLSCNYCSKVFISDNQLKEHLITHTETEVLRDSKDDESEIHENSKDGIVCRLCGQTFANRKSLKTHKNVDHKDKEEGFCVACNQLFPNENMLRKHVTKEHARVVCQYCKNSYSVNCIKEHLKKMHHHSMSTTEKDKLTCSYCSKILFNEAQLKDHLNTHTGHRPYSCKICGNSFHSRPNYRHHIRTIHDSNTELLEPRQCKKCDFSTNNRLSWIKHLKCHKRPTKNVKRHICSFCPKTFYTPKYLSQHESFAHGDQKLAPQCHICNRKFPDEPGLKNHMNMHSEERKYKCKICPKTFKQLSTLSTHEKLHKGKNIQCPQCDKKYITPADLRVHMRSHTGELPFECHLCDKKFAIKVRLTYHLRKHEGVLSKCPHCPLEFTTKTKLRFHVFEHIGYPYNCDLCDIGYDRRRRLYRHMMKAHKTIMTDEELKENYFKYSYKYFQSKNKTSEEEEELSET